MKLNYVSHTFGQGHTIEAVVRLYNQHDLERDMILSLVDIFNSANPNARPPKLGQSVKVPVFMSETSKQIVREREAETSKKKREKSPKLSNTQQQLVYDLKQSGMRYKDIQDYFSKLGINLTYAFVGNMFRKKKKSLTDKFGE